LTHHVRKITQYLEVKLTMGFRAGAGYLSHIFCFTDESKYLRR